MGFHEDDRIRAKNQVGNSAHLKYDAYKAQQWSCGDIATEAEKQLAANPGNKVMYEVLKLAVRESTKRDYIPHNQD